MYRVQIIHCDRDDWFDDLVAEVQGELRTLGLHRSVQVELGAAAPRSGEVSVAVCLGSPRAAADPVIADSIACALDAGRVVIPVVEKLCNFSASTPALLQHANGLEWQGPPRLLARFLLEELGIEERQRRVFISHKRTDGRWVAEQLYDELQRKRFTPFVDRFCLRAGEKVQDAIADKLEDYAFLLLLETPLAHTSDWVFDEVDYALSHTMGTLIISWPGDPPPVPGSQGPPRLRLKQADLAATPDGVTQLSSSALDDIVREVEGAHAAGLSRRRRMLIQSIEEAVRAGGSAECIALPEWRLRVIGAAGSSLVGVTPRLPTVRDLRLLDQAREGMKVEDALLVHSARVLQPELIEHLKWAVGDRELELLPENAVGGRW